jgi:hypothetical protein
MGFHFFADHLCSCNLSALQKADNTIITPEHVTTLLQQHIISTLTQLNNPIFLELRLAVGSEVSE